MKQAAPNLKTIRYITNIQKHHTILKITVVVLNQNRNRVLIEYKTTCLKKETCAVK